MLLRRILAAICVLCALGQPFSAFAEQLQALRVGNQKSGLKLLLEAAGELKDAPYPIQFSEFTAAAPLGEALNAEAIDIGGLGDAPYVFALGAGGPLQVVEVIRREGRYATNLLVPKDSPIQTPADLKSKRIAVNRGSIGHYLAIRVLNQAGLQSSDVAFINLLPSEAHSALITGQADAWATWEPFSTLGVTQDGDRILHNGEGLLTNDIYLAATRQAIATKRPQLEDFVKRLERAFQWANGHLEQYAAAQAKVTGLPAQVHRESLKGSKHSRVPVDKPLIDNLQKVADIYLKEKIILRPVDVSQGFDASFNSVRPDPPRGLDTSTTKESSQ